MTTLQEAARNAIMALQEARTRLEWFVDSYPHDVVDKKNFFVGTDAAIESLRTALAQQGEQQPSAYLTIADTGDMVWPPEAYDEACTYCDDDENPVPLYTAAPAPQPEHECTRSHPHELMDGYCELRTEIARLTNENARLKAAPQPAQDVPETNFGNMPTKFLANGTRFKVNFDGDGGV